MKKHLNTEEHNSVETGEKVELEPLLNESYNKQLSVNKW